MSDLIRAEIRSRIDAMARHAPDPKSPIETMSRIDTAKTTQAKIYVTAA